MNHLTPEPPGSGDDDDEIEAGATLRSATTIAGHEVCSLQDEKLGRIQDVVLDIAEGRIRYAVLALSGIPGRSDRLFVVPWKALAQDEENRRFMLNLDVERLKNAPGFDRNQWPNMTDATTWNSTVDSYYAR